MANHLRWGQLPSAWGTNESTYLPLTGRPKYASGAEHGAEKPYVLDEIGGKRPSAAKAAIHAFGFMRGIKPPPPSELSFSAACEVHAHTMALTARLKSRTDTKSDVERVFCKKLDCKYLVKISLAVK